MEERTAARAVTAVELRRIALPLVTPFRTSFGTQERRDILLVRVLDDDVEGWGECVALAEPVYSAEWVEGAQAVIERFLLPRLFAAGTVVADDLEAIFEPIRGHRMAKAAVEMAVLDAELRRVGQSWSGRMGGIHDRVPSGVSVGIHPTVPELLDAVAGYLDAGYVRIKLKVEPGWDLEPVAAVRERFGDVPLQVDANAAYSREDIPLLCEFDQFELLLVEQPFGEEDLGSHIALRARSATPVCLDESILSAQVCRDAIDLDAVDVVNIKPGRVGGYLEARRIHDLCLERGVPVWCGGMVETGLGRAANIALASAPGFTLPGDVSASDRFYRQDVITEPFVLDAEGHVHVRPGPGLGVDVDVAFLDEVTTSSRVLRS